MGGFVSNLRRMRMRRGFLEAYSCGGMVTYAQKMACNFLPGKRTFCVMSYVGSSPRFSLAILECGGICDHWK